MRQSALLILSFLMTALPVVALERGEVTLEACHLDAPDTPYRPEAFCARVEVPEDHAVPEGRQIELRVAILPAIRRDQQPDPLVLLAGGPGQASTEAFLGLLSSLREIRRERDLVLIDQRGTGRLSLLQCEAGEEDLTFEPEAALRLLEECLEEIEATADPSQYTTAATVTDLDLVLGRLGYEAVNLYGVSYGTRVAQLFARTHPERVRSQVLDGIAPLDVVLGQSNGPDAQRALELLFERCRTDPKCDAELPDLGPRLEAFLAELERQPLAVEVNHPRTGEAAELELSRTVAAQILRFLIYSPETAAVVPLLIDRAADGDVSSFAAQWLMVADGLSSINPALSMSVTCGEDAPFFDPEAKNAGFLRDDVADQLRNVCEIWPHTRVPDEEKQPLESAVPTLLLSGENDPVTPPAYGEQLLRTLSDGLHVVVPGMGHNVLGRGCVRRLMADFVAAADPEVVDPSCASEVEPLGIFLSFTGPLIAGSAPAADDGADADAASDVAFEDVER